MKKFSKVAKFQILKPLNMEWETFRPLLWSLQADTRGVLNRTTQYEWDWFCFKENFRKDLGKYPNKDEELDHYEGISRGKWLYHRMTEEFPYLNTGNLSQTMQFAQKRFKTDYRDILRGTKSVPSFRRDQPIDLKKSCFKVTKDDRGFVLKTGFLSKEGMKNQGLPEAFVEMLISPGDSSGKTILNRLVSGEYDFGASKIQHIKQKWMLYLTYQFERQEIQRDKNIIMGIDLGITEPLYMAFSNSDKRRFTLRGAKGEIDHFRQSTEARRRSLRRQGSCCGDGRIGHGRETRIAPAEKVAKKVSNFRDTCNHKYSRRVIEIANRMGCGVIQMENLSGIGDLSKFLKNWTYYDLEQKIKYKAEEVGIEFRIVEPRYTSQRCSNCGHIAQENRPEQAVFKCVQCDYEENADFNAARNLATEGIEGMIDQAVKDWPNPQPKKSK